MGIAMMKHFFVRTRKGSGLILLLILSGLIVIGCKQNESEVLDSFTIGYSTPEGNKIWVRKAIFDRKYSKPVGSLGCCWQEAGKKSGVYDQPLPKHVQIEWIDDGDNLLYSAELDLTPDIFRRAKEMPELGSDNEVALDKGEIYLIVAMAEKGEVLVWLSNFPYLGENVRNRVLVEVGKTQAMSKPWQAPIKNIHE